jgi:hypothetical protein
MHKALGPIHCTREGREERREDKGEFDFQSLFGVVSFVSTPALEKMFKEVL